jgi:hypothetical protein
VSLDNGLVKILHANSLRKFSVESVSVLFDDDVDFESVGYCPTSCERTEEDVLLKHMSAFSDEPGHCRVAAHAAYLVDDIKSRKLRVLPRALFMLTLRMPISPMLCHDHLDHLEKVPGSFQGAGTTLILSKCGSVKPKVKFIGHRAGSIPRLSLPCKVEMIKATSGSHTSPLQRSFLERIAYCLPTVIHFV